MFCFFFSPEVFYKWIHGASRCLLFSYCGCMFGACFNLPSTFGALNPGNINYLPLTATASMKSDNYCGGREVFFLFAVLALVDTLHFLRHMNLSKSYCHTLEGMSRTSGGWLHKRLYKRGKSTFPTIIIKLRQGFLKYENGTQTRHESCEK